MDIKIEQKNLSHEAYNKIKLLILDNVLKSGEKIIQEKMAQKLGISRIPLIQALTILQKERLIEYNPRKGFTVRKISTKEFGTKTKAEAFGRIISHTAYHAGQMAIINKYGII